MGDDLFGIDIVGCKEEIGGIAFQELLGQCLGCAVAGDQFDAGGVGEGFGKRGQDGLKIGVGGNVNLARGGLCVCRG